MSERLAYVNGELVPESKASVHIYDLGFLRGETVFDITRTFNGKPFKLSQHIRRLYASLRYARLDPEMPPEHMERISHEVVKANEPLRGENADFSVAQVVTPGAANWYRKDAHPTVIVYCRDIHFAEFAKYYRLGAHVVTPSARQIPPQCMDPKIKTQSRMHHRLARLEAQQVDREAYPLLLDLDGNITELTSMSFFIVKNGKLMTSTTNNILCGVSRETVIELAEELQIPCVMCDYQVYDVYNADEAFATATSPCIIPVSRINGMRIGSGSPGPVTKRLLDKWSQTVGVDIVAQAESHLTDRA